MRRSRFQGQCAGVANIFQRTNDGPEIGVPAAHRTVRRIGNMNVRHKTAGAVDRIDQVWLFNVHMEGVQVQPDSRRANLSRKTQTLLDVVDQETLKAIERFNRERNLFWFRMGSKRFGRLDRVAPLRLSRGLPLCI